MNSAMRHLAVVSRLLDPKHGTTRALKPLLRLLHNPRSQAEGIELILRTRSGDCLGLNTFFYIDWEVFFTGSYEPDVVAVITRLMKPGYTAIDVGANIGVLTLAMARAGLPDGTVIALEPHPDFRKRLMSNLHLNGITNVTVESYAAGPTSGMAILHVPADGRHSAGSSLLSDAHEHLRDRVELPVPVVTLDELVQRLGTQRVDLVKIDVEGYEPAVLAGANETLQRYRPALIFEYTKDWWLRAGFELDTVEARLRSIGYSEFRTISWRGIHRLGHPLPRRANVLATARSGSGACHQLLSEGTSRA